MLDSKSTGNDVQSLLLSFPRNLKNIDNLEQINET